MLRACSFVLAVSLLAIAGVASSAQEVDLKAFLGKAIMAHGGKEKLEKFKAATVKFKGKLEIANMNLEMTGEQSVLFPDKFRITSTVQINNMNIESVQVFDGKSFWVSAGGNTTELKDEKLIKELKETLAVERAGGLIGLLKPDYQLSVFGDTKIKDQEALGIRVSKKGQRDITLFFDKKTHLLVKSEYRTRPPMGGEQEVTQEKYFFDYKDVMGVKSPKRIVVDHDGKRFMELDITETNLLESLDPGMFAKP